MGMRCAVLGAGSWGTALAWVLAGKGYPVTAWDRDAAVVEDLGRAHRNERHLPGLALPANLHATADLAKALEGAQLVVLAVPSGAVRQVAIEAKRLIHAGTPLVCAAEGLEPESLMTMGEVLEDVLPVPLHPYLAVLCGPACAQEVVQGLPASVVAAARWERIARQVQQAFATAAFHPTTSGDVVGCELAGAVKGVVAVAAGAAEELGLGAGALAALLARGHAELGRLAVRKGANPLTLSGLAGLGDLVLACTSDLEPGRRVGRGLAQGKSLEQVERDLGQVAEGVANARSLRDLARRLEVEVPICEAVFRVLHQGLAPREALAALLAPEPKPSR